MVFLTSRIATRSSPGRHPIILFGSISNYRRFSHAMAKRQGPSTAARVNPGIKAIVRLASAQDDGIKITDKAKTERAGI
jgi:hypothetical protein